MDRDLKPAQETAQALPRELPGTRAGAKCPGRLLVIDFDNFYGNYVLD
jgi:hypothetical protein